MKYLHATNALLLRSPSSALLSRSSSSSSSAAATLAIVSACRALSSSTASAYSSYSSTNKPAAFAARRPFSHTARAHAKKGSKRGGGGGDDVEPAAVAATVGGTKGKKDKKSSSSSGSDTAVGDADRPLPNGEDPFNLADVTYAFDKAERHHGEELKHMRTGGGKFNAEVIGALPVQVPATAAPVKAEPAAKAGKANKKAPAAAAAAVPTVTFPLRELATVAPLGGRRWSILAFEESSVRGIMSAVQRSEAFNQQPQRSEDNALELTLTVEPERAEELVRRAKETCQAWRDQVRDESHRREAVHKKWRADRLILSDDHHKLREKVKKLQDDRMKVIAQKEKEILQFIANRAG
ncbi:ribosome recycling factor domain-containing protein [Lasiosphaeria ovina]|uniref:Ribosome recycling factor domain-containing protein n=1 Tax=Lasiosphaeria ovina TaxID=92902 RepID=A0AAE0NJV4_9PEZI|nr:ribosome recycling factor domain-containing protein [Lasiosphaeria ovina]